MHARIAAFENRDATRTDEFVRRARDRQEGGGEVPDALAMYMLIDRDAGTALGISLFESEEAISAAEPVFERMGDDVPEELRGKRISVDTYEVAIHEVREGAAAARVSTFSGPTDMSAEDIRRALDDVLSDLRSINGWKGIVSMVDRRSGTQKTMTLWESTAALRASEQDADALRGRAASELGGTIAGVDRFEVALAFDRAPRLVGA